MISLIVPARGQIAKTSKLLTEELGTAACIKSHVNKLSVIDAIKSCKQKLSLYKQVPPNGLMIFCGKVITLEGKEKMVNFDIEPFRPMNTGLYHCDNKFHTAALHELLDDDNRFGFIVLDGKRALFATLSGNNREILHKLSVDLPKKHGRGGQSAPRFSRIRQEKRHNYITKVAETAAQLFITSDRVNVSGLILAGSAELKTDLSKSGVFDPKLREKIIKVVDVSYGGINGLNQAIELASESLGNLKFVQEKKLIERYFEEISQNTSRYCFGVDDTFSALEMGAVETLIVWENLNINRYVLRNHTTNEEKILFLNPDQEKDKKNFIDKKTGVEMELVNCISLLEWLAENYNKYGTQLEIVTDRSQAGNQFVKGFGGIGGLLRYRVDFQSFDNYDVGTEFDLDEY